MDLTPLRNIDLDEIRHSAGSASYGRGQDYAQSGAVTQVNWHPADLVLSGEVIGSSHTPYRTRAYFCQVGRNLVFEDGECSCPVSANCKHVVATVITAKEIAQQHRPSEPQAPVWEQVLGSMLTDPPGRRSSGEVPLAMELTVMGRDPSAPQLGLRPVRPGKNGWVAGGLTWPKLARYGGYAEEFRPDHVQLLSELYSLYRSGKPGAGFYYGDDRSLSLAEFDSRLWWQLLDQARSLDLRLVHGRKSLGDIDPYVTAELSLDLTRADTDAPLVLTPVIQVDGAGIDARPVQFIGAEAHGLVYVDGAQPSAFQDLKACRLHLARLGKPVPPAVQELVRGGHRLEIPAAESSRFRDEYFMPLRRRTSITSSDGSFTAPVIGEPTLIVHARYRDGHRLSLDFDWEYRVDGRAVRAPLVPDHTDQGFRDQDREHHIWRELVVPVGGRLPTAELTGLETLRFSTEVLPRWDALPGVAVRLEGTAADYREVGDQLAIEVSTSEIPGQTDWFDLGVTITVEGRPVPFVDVFTALHNGQTHMLLPDGGYFSLHKPELDQLRRLIEEARRLSDGPADELRISRFHADLWDELSALGVVTRQAEAWQRQVQGLLTIDSIAGIDPPATLKAELRPYQVDGFRWLSFLWEQRLGGILADDMGLGKTLQTLALICHARQQEPAAAPFVVVAPTSVVAGWASEAARFAPGLRVVTITDTLKRRGQQLPEVIAGADIVVTSYTLLRLDFEHYASLPWSGLIMDEAQAVKNHQSKIYQCARRMPAPVKIAITGTPMENNLMELWSLLSITAPGLYPVPARFREDYAGPIEKNKDAERLGRLRRRIKPLIKRRTKEQVAADLPAKLEQVLEVELHPAHRTVYQTQLQRERQKILGLIDDLDKNRFTILTSLTLLRRLSLHAGFGDEKDLDVPSAKITALLEHLTEVVEGGHRALVFSQFTGFLELVRAGMAARGIEHCYLDGKTRNRAEVITQFKDGSAPVFLISLKAGGFGLNLTEADYCFLLDPWWNPATEAQAVDRTHRIGQTRTVMVYRLIAKDTIEEKVMALQHRKAELFTSVMDDGAMFDSTLSAQDIRELLT
ncbi:helicase [Pseudonocardiaceae bacterium YIM PH 21723]|nr:helicase [Pseudonocardiaceae bacterium YIM PH 21723]